jgi:ribosomal protein L15
MISYELHLAKQSGGGYPQASTNVATRGRGTPWNHGGNNNFGRGRGRGHSRGSGHTSSRSSRGGHQATNYRCLPDASGGQSKPCCQVCWKVGHTVGVCWYKFDEEYVPDQHQAAHASSSNTVDPNWHLDSGTTDHITSELEKLTMHERYGGNEQIRAANGVDMDIVHIGNSVLPTSTRPLHLNRVLHIPHAHNHLVSIHRFNLDNNTFVELHPFFFLIKDQVTRKVLLHGPCKGGLYPLLPLSSTT